MTQTREPNWVRKAKATGSRPSVVILTRGLYYSVFFFNFAFISQSKGLWCNPPEVSLLIRCIQSQSKILSYVIYIARAAGCGGSGRVGEKTDWTLVYRVVLSLARIARREEAESGEGRSGRPEERETATRRPE